MGKLSITGLGRAAWELYQGFETLKTQSRAKEQEQRALASIEENKHVQRFVQNPTASNKLGDGRLANLQDAQAELAGKQKVIDALDKRIAEATARIDDLQSVNGKHEATEKALRKETQ